MHDWHQEIRDELVANVDIAHEIGEVVSMENDPDAEQVFVSFASGEAFIAKFDSHHADRRLQLSDILTATGTGWYASVHKAISFNRT